MLRSVRPHLSLDPMSRLEAARKRVPAVAAFSGLTAAWLHGLDVAPCDPIEMTAPKSAGVSGRSGIAVRRSHLGRDVVTVRGLRAISVPRMLADLAGRLSLTEAVVVADAALHKRLLTLDTLSTWVASNPRLHGIRALRRVLTLAEPAAESPMESRLRMLLVLGGLPRPKAQVPIHDEAGRFVGRPDLYYDSHRLAIEYDGDLHRRTLVEDNRRQNRLINADIRLLRFTASDVLSNPGSVLTQVGRALVPAQISFRGVSTAKVPALLARTELLGRRGPVEGALR
jgi:very-short-patch-repair endonuclease